MNYVQFKLVQANIQPYYCEESYCDVVIPVLDIRPDTTENWLVIGRPGVDGIEFRIKNNSPILTVYAYHPIGNKHTEIAESPNELVRRWKSKDRALTF